MTLDPHGPNELRCNGTLSNVQEFIEVSNSSIVVVGGVVVIEVVVVVAVVLNSRSSSMIKVYIVMVMHYEQPYCISVLYSY